MKQKNKNHKLGFTLLELLVVVLIIGILAAIALPQYQIAVGKAKLSTLKEFTRSLGEARNRYFLIHGSYPTSVSDLDIDVNTIDGSQYTETWFKFTTSQDISCTVWTGDFEAAAACSRNILGKQVAFRVKKDGYTPHTCLVYSEDKNDKANTLCKNETGRTSARYCTDGGGGKYCVYSY